MKLLRILTIGVVAMSLGAPTASAQVSIGAGASNLGGDGIDLTGGAIDFTGKFNQYLGWSLSSQIGGSYSEGGLSAELDYFAAAKLRAGVTVDEGFLFLTAGYGSASLQATACFYIYPYGGGCASDDATESDFVYGVGFEAFFGANANWGLGLEYNTGSGDFDGLDQLMGTIRYQWPSIRYQWPSNSQPRYSAVLAENAGTAPSYQSVPRASYPVTKTADATRTTPVIVEDVVIEDLDAIATDSPEPQTVSYSQTFPAPSSTAERGESARIHPMKIAINEGCNVMSVKIVDGSEVWDLFCPKTLQRLTVTL